MALFDPAHPGELLRETIENVREQTGEKLTVGEVAEHLGVTRKTLSALINCKQKVTPEMALRLEACFLITSAQFWLNAQEGYDLAQAKKSIDISNVRALWNPGVSVPV